VRVVVCGGGNCGWGLCNVDVTAVVMWFAYNF
jgi:hypothetical protein